MKSRSHRHLYIGAAMLAAAALAFVVTPRERMADSKPPIDLESMVPMAFDGWRIDTSLAPVTVSPDVQAQLDKLYGQTLSRTYINARGERVMLSIAYGGTQSRSLQVHRPEVCYTAQGFQIGALAPDAIDVGRYAIPVMRVEARLGTRQEPITYWVRLGEHVVRGNLEQGLARLRYGLQGVIPDGMLVRVSSISVDTAAAYATQGTFVTGLLKAVTPEARARIVGERMQDDPASRGGRAS